MTMFATPVGYVGYTQANSNQVQFGNKKVNPHKESIFIDPQTGGLTTIRPGLVVPEKKKGNGGIIGFLVGAALAFVFRGKIKNLPIVKNTVIPAIKNGWNAVKNSGTKVADFAKNGWNTVKTYTGKVWNAVKNLFKKTPTTTP